MDGLKPVPFKPHERRSKRVAIETPSTASKAGDLGGSYGRTEARPLQTA
jgi:hypothetical protein